LKQVVAKTFIEKLKVNIIIKIFKLKKTSDLTPYIKQLNLTRIDINYPI
jgi:molybdenum cofactor biosynthesis enzyme